LYFNDDVYVGWVQNSPMLEIASVDPEYGPIFYVLGQAESSSPSFSRLNQPCLSCHGPARDEIPSPLLLVMSVGPDATGEPIGDFLAVSDRTPLVERWGGWYVSGSSGAAHRGNLVTSNGTARLLNGPSTATPSFDISRYLTAHSDIVALMLLSHQVNVHNRISEAAHEVRTLPADAAPELINDAVEPLVRSLLFSGAQFSGVVKGTSSFAQEFSARGPRDRNGRSLRELDLERRLLRYPLSHLIYSESFDRMPVRAREFVYRRLSEIFSGSDRSEAFKHLLDTDRSALLQILTQTKPEFEAWSKKAGTR
jgi:hypothetical protein